MFLDNLSANVLHLCAHYHLSYERASERCDLSERYFGSIARGKTAPTVLTLEKLCNGFGLTPNDLLLIPATQWKPACCQPLAVPQIRCYRCITSLTLSPLCPRCDRAMEREYRRCCGRCGQCLAWRNFEKAALLLTNK